MTNPWLKKNPLLSVWLSSLNRSVNTVRGHALNEARRQSSSALSKGYEDMLRLWSGAWMLEPKAQARRKRRR